MKIYQTLTARTPIHKGWSEDQKYCTSTAEGIKYMLRIASPDRMERKNREYAQMQKVAALGIPMCQPVECGLCEEGVYSIQTWIDGVDAEEALITMDSDPQYDYGLDAGRILAKIHTLPAPDKIPDWECRFNEKIDRKIAMYEACELKYPRGESSSGS